MGAVATVLYDKKPLCDELFLTGLYDLVKTKQQKKNLLDPPPSSRNIRPMLMTTRKRCVTFSLVGALALRFGVAAASHNKPQTVHLVLLNKAFEVQTKAKTVADLMKEVGIPASSEIRMTPAPSTKLKGVKEVAFPRLEMEIMEFPVEIPAPVRAVQQWDGSFSQSWQKTAAPAVASTPGRPGKGILKSLYFFQDGKLLGYTEKT